MSKTKITIETIVNAPVSTVWKKWNNPEDIKQWNHASDDWHTTHAESDFREGGKFSSRMEAKDGSIGFDFWGNYTKIEENSILEYLMGDGRNAWIRFEDLGNQTKIVETFEAEDVNSIELQQNGWQAILDNFKKHVEAEE